MWGERPLAPITKKGAVMARIFISYRRSDSRKWADKLFDHISMRFGKDLIFQDVGDIKPGKDFLRVLRDAIKGCKVVLVLIGPKWLRVKNADGTRRIDNPKDVLREKEDVGSPIKRLIMLAF